MPGSECRHMNASTSRGRRTQDMGTIGNEKGLSGKHPGTCMGFTREIRGYCTASCMCFADESSGAFQTVGNSSCGMMYAPGPYFILEPTILYILQATISTIAVSIDTHVDRNVCTYNQDVRRGTMRKQGKEETPISHWARGNKAS